MSTLLRILILGCGEHKHDHDHIDLPQGDQVKGEELFTPACSGCHGADGTGGYRDTSILGAIGSAYCRLHMKWSKNHTRLPRLLRSGCRRYYRSHQVSKKVE